MHDALRTAEGVLERLPDYVDDVAQTAYQSMSEQAKQNIAGIKEKLKSPEYKQVQRFMDAIAHQHDHDDWSAFQALMLERPPNQWAALIPHFMDKNPLAFIVGNHPSTLRYEPPQDSHIREMVKTFTDCGIYLSDEEIQDIAKGLEGHAVNAMSYTNPPPNSHRLAWQALEDATAPHSPWRQQFPTMKLLVEKLYDPQLDYKHKQTALKQLRRITYPDRPDMWT